MAGSSYSIDGGSQGEPRCWHRISGVASVPQPGFRIAQGRDRVSDSGAAPAVRLRFPHGFSIRSSYKRTCSVCPAPDQADGL